MTRLRVALLGTGGIAGEFLAPALARSTQCCLWSVLSRDRERAEAFAQRHDAQGPVRAYDQLDALLADPALDAVLIATPDRLHASQAIAAARAGKHVLCEKPMATSVDDARSMVTACDHAKVKLGVAYHLRHHTGHRALVQRLHAGALGTLRHVRIQWTYQSPDASNWRAHASVGRWWALGATGTHALDLARWILLPSAGEVTDIQCMQSSPRFGTAHDEMSVLTLRFGNGAIAEVMVGVLGRTPRRIEILGDNGFALAEDTLGPRGAGRITVNGDAMEFSVSDPYLGELDDFAHAVRHGSNVAVDGNEGARNVEILCTAAPERAVK